MIQIVGGEPTSGNWNGTPGPTYANEPVWVNLSKYRRRVCRSWWYCVIK